MDGKGREIFRAIHEGKWLRIEYRNKQDKVTRYWGAIKKMDPQRGTLTIDGMHAVNYQMAELKISYDSILAADILEGTWCETNDALVRDIEENSENYQRYFGNVANLKILNYLEMCYRMDTTPYCKDFALVRYLDQDRISGGIYQLREDQFQQIVRNFQNKVKNDKEADKGHLSIRRLAMNVLSIHTRKGLYVLAYRNLNLDVKSKCLRPSKEITVCREFLVDGRLKESARRFLDAEDYELLSDFEKNQELVKDRIMHYSEGAQVDDVPYVIGLGMDIIVNLNEEYKAIFDMFEADAVTVPIQAFFGNLLKRPRRIKAWPIALLDRRINMDQLLAINNAMKYPTAYIQGPPGTGKTNTIINTIVTAFFNERTVLFSSYNNHPLDGVFQKLTHLEYNGKTIPFPILRLGNQEKLRDAIEYIRELRLQAGTIKVYGDTLDKRKGDRINRAKELSALLKNYEEYLDLKEREETLQRMVDYQNEKPMQSSLIPFTLDLSGRQMQSVREEMEKCGDITEESALKLLDANESEFYQYLYYTSARYVKRLEEERYKELRDILEDDSPQQLELFAKYLSQSENVKLLQRVFPVIVTTCLSAHRLGEPEPIFDMVIMDEASQCNTAVSLIPILRGQNLMLVGDPQQLSPVILLDEAVNDQLRKKYQVPQEYDYRKNSIYKVFLACDSVSDETLLHNHYRCNKKIIDFNNKKYYSSKLSVLSQSKEEHPLLFVDIPKETSMVKNTSFGEAERIVKFLKDNPDKSVGIITPFVNQRQLIEQKLKENGLSRVPCGTVHSFQGDEKDIVLFSTAIGEGTNEGTYEWLRNNRELINVATSRAKEKLVVLGNQESIERLHKEGDDDFYELVRYVQRNGQSEVSAKQSNSRALGVKPYSTETEEAFLQSLTHALGNIWLSQSRFAVKREVPISQVFTDDYNAERLFYTGRFDYVVYEKMGEQYIPILAIELDGKEHYEDEVVKLRDQRKNAICRSHNLQLIRVENAYARRYNYIKNVLTDYFRIRH